MFRSMPFLLVIIIAAIIALDSFIPLPIKQNVYALSLTIKSGIIFILPIIIFSLLFKTMVNLSNRATTVIILILSCVMCSNFIAAFLSHYVGESIYQLNLNMIKPNEQSGLILAWSFIIPKMINNNIAMFGGIITGILMARFKPDTANRIANKLDALATNILHSFKYVIPFFVAGFVIKLQYDGVIDIIVKDYAMIFLIIAAAQFCYITFAYAALNSFNIPDIIRSMKNMLPAVIAGFSAMSSAAVMPLTIEGVAANTTNKDLAKSVVPITVNIHLIGDCIAIPIFAYALMKSFAMPEPALMTYIVFVCYFVIAKFSVAAVPGGGIIVMLPILEKCLGFTPEMLSMITALYILFDPVVTSANVFANGAFAKLIADRICSNGKSEAVQIA